MAKRIALIIVFVASIGIAIGAWPEAIFWMLPINRKINPGHPSGQFMFVAWLWSLGLLPVLIGLSFFRFRAAASSALAVLMCTPLFFLWASSYSKPRALHPSPLNWVTVLSAVLLSVLILIVNMRSWGSSTRRIGMGWPVQALIWSVVHAVTTYIAFYSVGTASINDCVVSPLTEKLLMLLALPLLLPVCYMVGHVSSWLVVWLFLNSMIWGGVITLVTTTLMRKRRNAEQA